MAGSVAMCCRLQWYPPPRLISYKITGIGGLWGFVVPLSKVSTLVAQGPDLGHYGFSSNQTNANRTLPRRLPCAQ